MSKKDLSEEKLWESYEQSFIQSSLFPQSFKFGDISEINENISFLSSLVNARKITVFQRYACGEHARTRVRGHREQRAAQSYIKKKAL